MLLWKLLVVADLLVLVGYSAAVWKRQECIHGSDLVTLPINLVGTIGLIIYAFSIPPPWSEFWRLFLPIFAASGAWEISAAMNTDHFNVGTVIGAALALILVGFTSVAVYRLGGSHWIGILGV